jgi:IMP dehydrogenase
MNVADIVDSKIALTYDDVSLEPRFSSILSRSHVDLSSPLSLLERLELPVIAAPMDTISEAAMAVGMRQSGGIAYIHRYNDIDYQVDQVNGANCLVGAAVGATGDFLERAQELYKMGCKHFCIDVAHGHHVHVMNAILALRDKFGSSISIMAGSIATGKAGKDLANWGADILRVGIGGGSICSTRLNTGHGVPNITAIANVSHAFARMDGWGGIPRPVIVADGGIRTSGDMLKAIAAGADLVMVGSMLAGTDETPGESREIWDVVRKQWFPVKDYRGMASRAAQTEWRGKSSAPEGVATTVPCKGPVASALEDIRGRLQSGLSLSGARTIEEFQNKATFIRQTAAGVSEASTHINNRNT